MDDENNLKVNEFMPFPVIVVNKFGKIEKLNSLALGLGEGAAEGIEIQQLTGKKYQDLLDASIKDEHPVMERDGKAYKLYIKREEEEDGVTLTIFFTDVSVLEDLKDRYNAEKPCVVKINIDNYDELVEVKGIAVNLNLSAEIDMIIRRWAGELNASLGRVRNNRYLIWMGQAQLDKAIQAKFSILDEVRALETGADFPASLSMGIGVGGRTIDVTESYADAALDLALGRGGDQAVIKRNTKIEYYGGKLQSVEKNNKGKSRIMGHAIGQLISQSEKVFIMGHVSSDMDSFGASLGMRRLCKLYDKEPYIVIESPNESLDILFNTAKKNEEIQFIDCEKAKKLCEEDSLVIVLDVHIPNLVQCPELLEKSERIVVIDHHRKMEKCIENPVLSYMESYASSASEMVSEILQYMTQKKDVEKIEAEALLAGITVDSNRFSMKAGVRTFEAAAWLRRQGADPTEVKRFFQQNEENLKLKAKALSEAVVLRNGIAYTSFDRKRSDAQLICAQLADDLLTIKGVKAAFVAGRDMDRRTVISARSMGEVNVQVIMEKMGGGGHLTTAAAQVDVSVEGALKKVIEITEEKINESNS